MSCGRRCCAACCASIELWLSGLLIVLWCAASGAATAYGLRADDAGEPQQGARTAVWAMGWAEAGLWL